MRIGHSNGYEFYPRRGDENVNDVHNGIHFIGQIRRHGGGWVAEGCPATYKTKGAAAHALDYATTGTKLRAMGIEPGSSKWNEIMLDEEAKT